MLLKFAIIIIVCFAGYFPANAQKINESSEYNPIFDTVVIPEKKLEEKSGKEGLIEIKLSNILSSASFYRRYWLNEINKVRGHFFMMEATHTLPNKVKIAFSQLRSNVTCANYGEYTKPNEGDENCYMKVILTFPNLTTQQQIANVWMNGNADSIHIKPEANKQYLDFLINDLWYEYSPEKKSYILSPKNTFGEE